MLVHDFPHEGVSAEVGCKFITKCIAERMKSCIAESRVTPMPVVIDSDGLEDAKNISELKGKT